MRILAKPNDDRLRHQGRAIAIDPDQSIQGTQADFGVLKNDATPRSPGARQGEMSALLTLIDQLPASQQEVLLTVDVHGYGYAEAMQLLAIPMNTLKSRLSRARTTVRDGLVETGQIPGRSA